MSDDRPHDSKGYPAYPGDIIRIYHFTDARRKKYWMYRLVVELAGNLWSVCIHDLATKSVDVANRVKLKEHHSDFEIIEGYGPGKCIDYLERPRRVPKQHAEPQQIMEATDEPIAEK